MASKDTFDPVEYLALANYYSKGCASVCKVAYQFPDRVVKKGFGPCHAMLGYGDQKGATGLYSSLWVCSKEHYQQAVTYWDYLFNEKISPWKSLLKPGYKVFRDAKDRPVGFFLPVDLETSSQLLANFCMATRLPTEHPDALRAFETFLAAGFAAPEALYFSSFLSLDYNKAFYENTQGGWHAAFDQSQEVSLDLIRAGSPDLDNRKFARGDTYYPTNMIWYGQLNGGLSALEYLRGDQKYTGVFKKLFVQYYYNGKFEGGLAVTKPNDVINKLKEWLKIHDSKKR